MGKWSEPWRSFSTFHSKCDTVDPDRKVKSIQENVLKAVDRCVGWESLKILKLYLSMRSEINFPRAKFFSDPHISAWALKSPSKINGFGSCLIRLSNSFGLKFRFGDMYMLQLRKIIVGDLLLHEKCYLALLSRHFLWS